MTNEPGQHTQSAAILFFICVGYVLISVARNHFFERPIYTAIGVLVFVSLYLVLKGYFAPRDLGAQWQAALGATGLSYILFRVLQIFVGLRGRTLDAVDPLDYLLFLFFFPSFLSGPVSSYAQFQSEMNGALSGSRPVNTWSSLSRAAVGFFKLYFVAPWFHGLTILLENVFKNTTTLSAGQWEATIYFGIAGVAFLLHLYVNFSGYMDIVVGAGLLLGVKMPENFDRPLESTDFLDLWRRWHITVSFWFRDYVFNPLMRFSISKFARSRRRLHPYIAIVCFSLTFVLMGLWHGVGLRFLCYGLFLGACVGFYKLWELLAPKSFRTRGPMISLFRRTLTFVLFSGSLLLIRYDGALLRNVQSQLSLVQLSVSAVILFLSVLVTLLVYDGGRKLMELWEEYQYRLEPRTSYVIYSIWVGVIAYLILIYAITRTGGAPVDVIYKTF